MLNSLKLYRNSILILSQISEDFEEVQVQSRGFGILDVGYRSKVMIVYLDGKHDPKDNRLMFDRWQTCYCF